MKLVIGGIGKRTSDRDIPHFRIDSASVRAAELRAGHPPWNTERDKFVHIQTDSEDDVRRSIDQLADEDSC